MADKTLADHITDIIHHEANNNPAPIECKVTRNYTNEPTKIDVTTVLGEFKYIDCLNSNTIGRKGILVFLNGETPFAIIETRSL